MKNWLKNIGIASLSVLTLASCDSGFEDLNKNPNAYEKPSIQGLFTLSEMYMNGQEYENHRANMIYASAMIQHFASFGWNGDKYSYTSSYSGAFFGSSYKMGIKEVSQLLHVLPNTPENANVRSAARIMKAFMYQRLTDLYGDVPYFDASKGVNGLVFQPKYDKQELIYADLLKEIEESVNAFDVTKPLFGNADYFYKSDIAKWKKFGNSLMLRMAMRMSNVNPALAQTWAKKAIAGGVFTSNEDNLILRHVTGPEGINRNPSTTPFIREDLMAGNGSTKLSKTFIDLLKNTNDPRMRIYAKLEATKNNNPADQKGLPNGFNNNTILNDPSWDDATKMKSYSDLNTSTLLRSDAPQLIMTYAETQFLLAEAALRGWDNGNAKTYYENGVTAAMKMLQAYGTAVTPVSDNEISEFLTNNPWNDAASFSAKLENIITQKWVSLMLNGLEAYAEWRRTGFPTLQQVNFPGNVTNGKIPRRLIYDETERINNAANYLDVIKTQGADDFNTRIWWDKANI